MLNIRDFPENFGVTYLASIRDQNSTFSATEDSRIAFVSTEDIADAAYQGLTAEPSLNKDLLIVGPELFSYDEVCPLKTCFDRCTDIHVAS